MNATNCVPRLNGYGRRFRECADELEVVVEDRYRDTKGYPSEKRKYDRDIAPVLKAAISVTIGRNQIRVVAERQHRLINEFLHVCVIRVDPMVPRCEKCTLVIEAIGDNKVRVNHQSLDSPLVILANQALESSRRAAAKGNMKNGGRCVL